MTTMSCGGDKIPEASHSDGVVMKHVSPTFGSGDGFGVGDQNSESVWGFSPLVDPMFTDVTVHDPSILRVDDTYYIFGSHLASAKSQDLVQWEQITERVTPDTPYFLDVFSELAETFAWSSTDTLWANDVIQLADGKYYMYYNSSRDDSPRATMGVAVADSIEGPYTNQGIILHSGNWDLPSEDGTIYNPLVHPNVVDPDTFFDAEGNLWMIYGSYSGGIFILRMNPETGMPMPGQGFGTHLMGGNHSRIEGAYVMYSPETEYYYMFTSFGGLTANGAYNIRVSRSENPDGPYYDGLGNDMAQVQSDPELPLFDDASIQPFAQKLMGNFLFDRKIGEEGEGIGTGYVSPGHNSATYDNETGQYFLIFHTRFPDRGEFHQVRVHEMFMNNSGWPVVAPHRYAPKPQNSYFPMACWPTQCLEAPISYYEIAGDYKLIDHGKEISADIVSSDSVVLTRFGSIFGARTGTWSLGFNNTIQLNFPEGVYEGVVTRQWSEVRSEFVVTFSVQSSAGVSIWGSQLPWKFSSAVVNEIVAELHIDNSDSLTRNVVLPVEATRGATISWSSSNPAVINSNGVVSRPQHGAGDVSATVTAIVRFRGRVGVKTIAVTVREQPADGLVAHYPFDGDLTDASGQNADGVVIGGSIGVAGGSISFATGSIGDAAVFDGASGIRLPDGLVNSQTYSVSFWLNPTSLNAYTTTFFAAANPDSWLSFLPVGNGAVDGATMLWSGSNWYDAGTGLNISENTWSHVAITNDQGAISVYINGELRFSGLNFPDVFATADGIVSLGVNWWDTPYQGMMDDLRIHDRVLSENEVSSFATH